MTLTDAINERLHTEYLSPTIKMSEQILRLLPDSYTPIGEINRLFYIDADDYSQLIHSLKLAVEKRENLADSYYTSLNEYAGYISEININEDKMREESQRIKEALEENRPIFLTCVSNSSQDLSEKHIQIIVDIFRQVKSGGNNNVFFFFYGEMPKLIEFLRKQLHILHFASLTSDDYKKIIGVFSKRVGSSKEEQLSDNAADWYARQMGGLSVSEVRGILEELRTNLLVDSKYDYFDYLLLRDSTKQKILQKIGEYKKNLLEAGGRLKLESIDGNDDLESMQNVKEYLNEQKEILNRQLKVKAEKMKPLGMMMVGLPGTGKSMASRLAAKTLDLPLYSLNMSRILGGLVGESEKNMERMLDDLRRAAPCILWIDEIEKAMSGADGKSDGTGVVRRLFGSLLTFIQENKTTVFLTITANDISSLPPEMFRNGRIDRVFSCMLPSYNSLEKMVQKQIEAQAKKLDMTIDPEIDYYALLNYCVGTKDHPRFLTGADITAHIKFLFIPFFTNGSDFLDKETCYTRMKEAASCLPCQVPSNSRRAVLDTSARYLDLYQRGFSLTETDSYLSKADFEINDVIYGNGKQTLLILKKEDLEDWQANIKSEEPRCWYDARLYEIINESMTESVVWDRNLTPEIVREAYIKSKLRYPINT